MRDMAFCSSAARISSTDPQGDDRRHNIQARSHAWKTPTSLSMITSARSASRCRSFRLADTTD